MGATRWSDDHYRERAETRAIKGTDAFEYDHVVRTTGDYKVHEGMNPHGVKVRESRDSDAHPSSRAIAVLCDVTGSMQTVPRIIQEHLPKLMSLLIRKGYLEHPHIMVGAIGDAKSDRAPLQVGQFEAGIEIEEDLGKLYLEGGGGPAITESYELAMYFLAEHTDIDCFAKRGQRGYAFLIGDEQAYRHVSRSEVQKHIGDHLQSDLDTVDVVKKLQEKYDVYFIMPNMTSNWGSESVLGYWRDLLGQHVLKLDDPAGICELIASTVGIAEGIVDVAALHEDLTDTGSSESVARAVSSALVPLASNRGSELTVPESGAGSGLARI